MAVWHSLTNIACIVAQEVLSYLNGVIVMMGKIDKISRVSSVKMDPNSPWLQRRNRDNQESFQDMLKSQQRKASAVAEPDGEAATWDGNGATQSLFYENGVNLDFFYRQRIGM